MILPKFTRSLDDSFNARVCGHRRVAFDMLATALI